MRRSWIAVAVLVIAAGCTFDEDPTPSPSLPSSVPPSVALESASPSPSATASPPSVAPSPTPEPSLSLDLPEATDERVVAVEVVPEVPPDGDGRIVVRVTSQAETRIDDLVLRWPTDLGETLFLAPFVPSEERIRDGGPPLVQPWTKWVIGPGERGEPDGTTSLGWGPLLPGATLEIPIVVTRRADGPVAFDFQVLAGNDLLQLPDAEPAELRIELP